MSAQHPNWWAVQWDSCRGDGQWHIRDLKAWDWRRLHEGEPPAPGPKLRETRKGPRWCVFGGKKKNPKPSKIAKAHMFAKRTGR